MKWVGIYFTGYTILIGAILLALYKAGVVQRVGWTWISIGLLLALGLGIMFCVKVGAPRRSSVEIDRN